MTSPKAPLDSQLKMGDGGPCNNFTLDMLHSRFSTCTCGHPKAAHGRGGGQPNLALEAKLSLRERSPKLPASPEQGTPAEEGPTKAGGGADGRRRERSPSSGAARGQEAAPTPVDELSPRTADLEVEHRLLQSHAAKLRRKREDLQRLRDQMEAAQHDINSSGGGDAPVSTALRQVFPTASNIQPTYAMAGKEARAGAPARPGTGRRGGRRESPAHGPG
jgi:hypothetical protein